MLNEESLLLSSRNLLFLIEESQLAAQRIMEESRRSARNLLFLVEESQLADQRIIQELLIEESLLLLSRNNLLLLIEGSPLADQRIIEQSQLANGRKEESSRNLQLRIQDIEESQLAANGGIFHLPMEESPDKGISPLHTL